MQLILNMALAPTNPDMMEVARKAHILSTQEDGYAALDEFRAMTHYSIEQLNFFLSAICKYSKS